MTRSITLRFRIAAAIALVAVAAGGFLLLRPNALPDAGVVAPPRLDGIDARSTQPPAVAAVGRAKPPAAQRTDALAEEWNDATHDVVGPIVEGTIIVSDQDGPKHSEEDGSFTPVFFDGVDVDSDDKGGAAATRHPPRRVSVKHGRFRFDGRGATLMLVEQVELGGRIAVVGRAAELTAEKAINLDAFWCEDVLLHVVDATSHAELDEVEVASAIHADSSCEHPGIVDRTEVVASHARSPLHLTRSTAIEQALLGGAIWVGAAGHAWSRATIDFERERTRTIELGPAGTLVVTVTSPRAADGVDAIEAPAPTKPRPRLRLRRTAGASAGALIAEATARPDEFEFDGLPPGELTVSIEEGDAFPTPRILGRAVATICAGATASVTLGLDPSMEPESPTLCGTMFVPESWGDAVMEIEIAPMTLHGGTRADRRWSKHITQEWIPERPGWRRWSIEAIVPTSYALRVERAGFETRVDVGIGGRDDVVLMIPEPALLRVHVVDADTLDEVDFARLLWRSRSEPDPIEEGSGESIALWPLVTRLEWNEDSRCFVAAVRPGSGRVEAETVDFSPASSADPGEERILHVGENEFVYHAHLQCGLLLEVVRSDPKIGSLLVHWDRVPAGEPPVLGLAFLLSSARVTEIVLPGPGRYRFTRRTQRDGDPDFLFEVDVPAKKFVRQKITVDR